MRRDEVCGENGDKHGYGGEEKERKTEAEEELTEKGLSGKDTKNRNVWMQLVKYTDPIT